MESTDEGVLIRKRLFEVTTYHNPTYTVMADSVTEAVHLAIAHLNATNENRESPAFMPVTPDRVSAVNERQGVFVQP